MAQGRKRIVGFPLLRSVKGGSTALGRFSLLASTQPGKSVMGAALDGPWGTPDHSGKGAKSEKVDCPGHGKVRGGPRVAEGLQWREAGVRVCT